MNAPPRLIGMIHLPALPGSPGHRLPVRDIITSARREAVMLKEAGFDGLLVENMHDRPYQAGSAEPQTVSVMTAACLAVREATGLPTGVQVLAAANAEALAVALAADLQFIRAEAFVFAHVADEGLLQSDAAALLRLRRRLGAEHIRVFTDLKKKHSSHALTADVDLAETARAAEFFLSDGIIITGLRTGHEPSPEDVRAAREATALPVLIGSGVTAENAAEYLRHADSLIVGSAIKAGGVWHAPVDTERARAVVRAAASA